VMDRLGLSYDVLRASRDDIVYVSNCGFGHSGPYERFKTWGPIVQAVCGLTFSSGLPDMPSAGWGYSYMDHQGANFMALAVLAGLAHRSRTGDGQRIDMSCTEAGATLLGPAVLDHAVNARPLRRSGMPNSNRSQSPAMAPHNIYPAAGDDNWIAIACRDDDDWAALVKVAGGWAHDDAFADLAGRLAEEDRLDRSVAGWTRLHDRFDLARRLQAAGVPAASVQRPSERIDADPNTEAWGLWPEVTHSAMGRVRVDGLPVHLSETDWTIQRGAPCLGQHNREVFGGLLGIDDDELTELHEQGVI
jgi:benzylsuccinate CoA-transferase BbsF subunit